MSRRLQQPDAAPAAGAARPDAAPLDAQGKRRRWQRDWRKHAHPSSDHAKFYDKQGLVVFAMRWTDSVRARTEEVQRRWRLQQAVDAASRKANAFVGGKRCYYDAADEAQKAEEILRNVQKMADAARAPQQGLRRLVNCRFVDAACNTIEATGTARSP